MKRLICLSVVLMVSLSFVNAATLSGKLDWGYKNLYLTNAGVTLHDDRVFQGSVFLEAPLGLYDGFWISYSPQDGINSDLGDEVDFIVGIHQEKFKLGFDFSYAYLNGWDINTTEADFHLLFLKVDFPKVLSISSYVSLEYDVPFDKDILPGGFIYRMGFSSGRRLLNRDFNFDFSVAGHNGAFGVDAQNLSSAQVEVNTVFKFSNMEFTPGIIYQKTLNYEGLSKDEFVWSINLSIPFVIID